MMFLQKIPPSLFFIILHGWVNYSGFVNLSLDLVRDLLTSWADNQYSSGMLQEALTSGCLGPTGKLGNCYFSFFHLFDFKLKITGNKKRRFNNWLTILHQLLLPTLTPLGVLSEVWTS